jgi:hypothetical protein
MHGNDITIINGQLAAMECVIGMNIMRQEFVMQADAACGILIIITDGLCDHHLDFKVAL